MDKRLDPYRFDVGRARVEPETPIVAGAFFTRKIIFTAAPTGWMRARKSWCASACPATWKSPSSKTRLLRAT